MEEVYVADRSRLRALLCEHPTWTYAQYAEAIGRSTDWVKKWRRRLAQAAPDDPMIMHSRSRAAHQRVVWDARVVERILDIRDQPPENLRRTPGPLAILYYLQRDETLQAAQVPLPRSQRTVWRILTQAGRIAHVVRPEREPVERPEPLAVWQIDFKDASTVPPEPDGKRQHVVEVLNVVTRAPRSSWVPKRTTIIVPRPSSRPSSRFSRPMGCLTRSCAIATHALWAVLRGATFPRPSSGSGTVWASR